MAANPVKRPQQARSKDTQSRILAAVEDMVVSGTYDQATVQEIVRLAKSSVGSFYARFRDKDAALYQFYDLRCAKFEQEMERVLNFEQAKALSFATVLDSFIDAVIGHTLKNAAILRAAAMAESFNRQGSPFLARAALMNKKVAALLAAIFEAKAKEYDHPDIRVAVTFVIAVSAGLTRDGILRGQYITPAKVNAGLYSNEIKRMLRGYLLVK